jgi:membrane-anchored glycerophosphoryl diester phosphodiesterase (GDPDase)
MKAVTGIVISFFMMAVIFLIGFMMISAVQAHANDSGSLTGSAATAWNNFVTYLWIALGILAFTPLIMTIMVFAGLFGMIGGQQGR